MPTRIAEAVRTALKNRSEADMPPDLNLCIKVMDGSGTVTSINDQGLKLLGLDQGNTLCGRRWFDMWSGKDRITLEMAVAQATMGHASTHHMSHGGEWLIDVMPLNGSGNAFETVLVVSNLLPEQIDEASDPAATASAEPRNVDLTAFAEAATELVKRLDGGLSQQDSAEAGELIHTFTERCNALLARADSSPVSEDMAS